MTTTRRIAEVIPHGSVRLTARGEIEDIADELLDAETRAVASFAAGTAYELEEPTNRLLVRLRALAESRALEGDDADSLARAIEAATRIEVTVRGLSAFHHPRSAPIGVDVHEAIELALDLARPELAGRATVHRAYEPVKRVQGDLGQLTLALLNVVRNAAASIPSGMPAANRVFVHTGVTADGRVALDVIDTGVGIEPDDVPYVFDPFFTTKPFPEAVGLGLAAARAAVRAMGGTIEVESAVGHGTRFHLALEPTDATDLPLPYFPRGEALSDRRVLCVARSASAAQQVGDLVDEEGTRLVFATVDDAVARLATGESFDLILCERGVAHEEGFRERVSRVAPEAMARTFTVPSRPCRSGVFERVPTRIASGTG